MAISKLIFYDDFDIQKKWDVEFEKGELVEPNCEGDVYQELPQRLGWTAVAVRDAEVLWWQLDSGSFELRKLTDQDQDFESGSPLKSSPSTSWDPTWSAAQRRAEMFANHARPLKLADR